MLISTVLLIKVSTTQSCYPREAVASRMFFFSLAQSVQLFIAKSFIIKQTLTYNTELISSKILNQKPVYECSLQDFRHNYYFCLIENINLNETHLYL